MERTSLAFLRKWLSSSNRRPLVIRGARQVGKTWLVRRLAEIEGRNLVEVNLERTPTLSQYFESNNPKEIIEKLSIRLGVPINPDQSILFIDEIQEKPELYGKLRWFAEDMPELPVIAAGSLLEFIFTDEKIHIPVGRIGYMYLEPLSFLEFLQAYDRNSLVAVIGEYRWDKEIHPDIHQEIMKYVKEYLYVGGMPQAAHNWITERSLENLNYIKNSILASYREDFKKYGSRIAPEVLDKVLEAIPRELGQKFVYSRVDEYMRHETVKKAFNLLCKARVTHSIIRTSANGVPLGAESHENFFKALLLDVGLCSSLLGLTLNQITDIKEIDLINKGAIAEQVVGQLLRTIEASVHRTSVILLGTSPNRIQCRNRLYYLS